MIIPTLYYCYDAYCGWCYGFSPVIKKISEEFENRIVFDVLSGGMILPEKPVHISATAAYIATSYKTVEELSGIQFGADYLWHINNPTDSDWYPNSEKPAIALAVFKDYHPNKAVAFSADLQYALHFEGRDLCDDEAYRHLVEKYELPEIEFYAKLHQDEYKQRAYYDFALCKQLQVTGFPAVFLQVSDSKFYQVARGFTPYETIHQSIETVLDKLKEGD